MSETLDEREHAFCAGVAKHGNGSRALREAGWTLFGEPFPLFFLYNLNPAARITGAFRSMLYDYVWPSWQDWLVVGLWAGIVLGLGAWVFHKFSARVVEEL